MFHATNPATSDAADERLVAFMDGELDGGEAAAVQTQLAADPLARERMLAFRQADDLLRQAFGPALTLDAGTVPPALRLDRPAGRLPSWTRAVVALAAMLLIGVIGFGAGYKSGGIPATTDELLDDVTSYHTVYARETEHLVEVPASRVSELTAWLGDRLGRKLVIPDLSPFGLSFAGGRMLVADGKPVAQLLFTRPGSMPLGVCITRAEKPPATIAIQHKNGVDAASWVIDDYAYVVVGQLPDDELRKVANTVAGTYGS